MLRYFAYDYHGAPFVLFGIWHLCALLVIVLGNLAFLGLRNTSEKSRRLVRWVMVGVLFLADFSWQAWNVFWGHWSLKTTLPLQLCSVMMFLAWFMLIFKNYRLYEFVYFIGIGGGIQALLTPTLGIYGFPHFRFFQIFISHGLLLSSGFYMTIVEGFRPTWKSLLRVAIGINLYLLLIVGVNHFLGSNYLFIAYKPATSSLLDLLPAWPWYIPWIEIIGLIVCLVLYLPFALSSSRSRSLPVTNHDTRSQRIA